jgi:hypothetical protein
MGSPISCNTTGNASASSPGLVSTGAQTLAGVKTFQDGILGATPLATWDGTADKTMVLTDRTLWITGLTDNRTLKLPKSGVKKGDAYNIIWTATTAAKLGTIKDNAGSNTIDTFGEGATGRATLIALMDEPDGALNTSWAVLYIQETLSLTWQYDTGLGSTGSSGTVSMSFMRQNKTVNAIASSSHRVTTGGTGISSSITKAAVVPSHFRAAANEYTPNTGYDAGSVVTTVCYFNANGSGDVEMTKTAAAWGTGANTGLITPRTIYYIA